MAQEDEDERRAHRSWLESGDPLAFLRWRGIRARRGELWRPILGQRVAGARPGQAAGIAVRITRRRVVVRDEGGRRAVLPIEEVVPALGAPAVELRRITCATCGRPFLVPVANGVVRAFGPRKRWVYEHATPFHYRRGAVPQFDHPCEGSEQFPLADDVWTPRRGPLDARAGTRVVFPDDRLEVRARKRAERGGR